MQAIPQNAGRLAYAGLLPFAGGTLLAWLLARPEDLDYHGFVMNALSVYAATVVSFIGALHWGVAMGRGSSEGFGWAVLPSLGAWVATLMPAYAGLVLHGVLLLVAYAYDRTHYPRLGLSHWLTLRFRCTLGASLCCFLAAAAT